MYRRHTTLRSLMKISTTGRLNISRWKSFGFYLSFRSYSWQPFCLISWSVSSWTVINRSSKSKSSMFTTKKLIWIWTITNWKSTFLGRKCMRWEFLCFHLSKKTFKMILRISTKRKSGLKKQNQRWWKKWSFRKKILIDFTKLLIKYWKIKMI